MFWKGVVMMVGKGGAMRIQRGNVTLLRSTFVNNSARLLGGSVFVDIARGVGRRGLLLLLSHVAWSASQPAFIYNLQGSSTLPAS